MESNLRRHIMMQQGGGSILPDEYQRVEWLQGGGAFINTGLKLNETAKISAKGVVLDAGYGNNWIFMAGARDTLQSRVEIQVNKGQDYFGMLFRDSNSYLDVSYSACLVNFDLYMDRYTTRINNNEISYSALPFQMQREFYIFSNNQSLSAANLNTRLNYFKIELNGVMYEYIPCYRKADNVAGMYDIVNDVFYTNAGTGSFIVGNPV